MSDSNKQKMLTGIFLILAACFCGVGIFYILITGQQNKEQTIEDLHEQVEVLKSEKELAERKSAELEEKLGKTINLKRLIRESAGIYGDQEEIRSEGYLWIDQGAGTLIVTLGALNGVDAGSRLSVYDGDERIGYVRVVTPMDVISYVRPVNRSVKDFKRDYYRVVVE